MHTLFWIIAVLLHQISHVICTPPAPLLGLGYVPPIDLTSNSSLVPIAWSNFTDAIETYIRTNTTVENVLPDLNSYTFSVGAFSLHDPEAANILQYHHTGPDVKNSTLGTTKADRDSVYRVASISKVFTVYLTLQKIGSGCWDSPITDFIPELAAFADTTPPDPINVVDWKSVTLGALAGQIAGIPRDTPLLDNGDPAFTETAADLEALAFPPPKETNPDDLDPCFSLYTVTGIDCPRTPYLQAVTKRAPVLQPWTSPVYTNMGFALLALAVENITNASFASMMQESILKPLNMTSTFYDNITDTMHAILPGGPTSNAGLTLLSHTTNDAPSGGIFSSTHDLATFGLSILNSTLLSPLETRKWLKPITHTNSLYLSVGRPWEILRILQPLTNRVTDLYAKEGDALGYSAYLVLIPDYGAGFSIMIAGNGTTATANTVVADTLTNALVPALEAQAAKESLLKFGGTYVSNSTTLNSSITLSVNSENGASGLIVESWISNSTSMFTYLVAKAGDEISLFPTNLQTPASSNPFTIAPGSGPARKIAFRGTFGTAVYSKDVGPFTDQLTNDASWADVDAFEVDGQSLDLFIFDVDDNGMTTSVTPAVTKAALRRV